MENKKKALGLGLEQLFNNENLDIDQIEKRIYDTVSNEEIIEIDLKELRPNPYQPRQVFDSEALQELADSIKEHGVFQPIIVKKSIKGYEIIAGERRVRASKLAGLEKIPAIVRPFTDEQMMEIALLENLQRENLSAIEEALAYKTMLEKLNLTQEQLSKKVGKSRSHITNILGLLRLPDEVQALVNDNKLTMGHARALSKLENDEQIKKIAKKIVDEKKEVKAITPSDTDYNELLDRSIKQKKTIELDKVEPEPAHSFPTHEHKVDNIDRVSNDITEYLKINTIIINNCFAGASKRELFELKNNWSKLNDYALDNHYGSVACYIFDGTVRAASSDSIIITFDYESMVNRGYRLLPKIEELFEIIFGHKIRVALLTSADWEKEKKEYIDKKNNGISYQYQEVPLLNEQLSQHSPIIDNTVENASSVEEAIKLFGENMVSID